MLMYAPSTRLSINRITRTLFPLVFPNTCGDMNIDQLPEQLLQAASPL